MRPDTLIHTEPGALTIGGRDDPRRASGGPADGRAGDPEVVERRRGEDRAVDAGRDDVARVLRRRLRHAAADRISRRGRGTPASGEELAADRAGDDVVRARHLGQPGAARARLHDLRDRRRAEAASRCSRPTDRSRGVRSSRRRPRARCARCWRWRRSPAAPRPRRRCPAIASRARPAPRTSSKAAAYADEVRVLVRRLRAGVATRDSIVAVMIDEPSGGAVLRRRRRRAGVLQRHGRCAAHARRAHRRAGRQRDPAAATAAEIREET